jgi:hypothetical protein
MAQSLLALGIIVTFAIGGWNPVLTLFYIGGTAGALGVLVLLFISAASVVGFFARDRRGESWWHCRIAPAASIGMLGVILALVLDNFAGLLGVPSSSPLRWGIPAGYLAVGLAGSAYGLILRVVRPDAYAAIGRGAKAVLPLPARPGSRTFGASGSPDVPGAPGPPAGSAGTGWAWPHGHSGAAYPQPFATLEPRIPIVPEPGPER